MHFRVLWVTVQFPVGSKSWRKVGCPSHPLVKSKVNEETDGLAYYHIYHVYFVHHTTVCNCCRLLHVCACLCLGVLLLLRRRTAMTLRSWIFPNWWCWSLRSVRPQYVSETVRCFRLRSFLVWCIVYSLRIRHSSMWCSM